MWKLVKWQIPWVAGSLLSDVIQPVPMWEQAILYLDCKELSYGTVEPHLWNIYICKKTTPPETCLSSAVLNWTERAFFPRRPTLSHSGHYGNLVKFVTGPWDNLEQETEFSFIQQPVIISDNCVYYLPCSLS